MAGINQICFNGSTVQLLYYILSLLLTFDSLIPITYVSDLTCVLYDYVCDLTCVLYDYEYVSIIDLYPKTCFRDLVYVIPCAGLVSPLPAMRAIGTWAYHI